VIGTYFASADEVPAAMREWFTGKRVSAPYGVHFEGSERVLAALKVSPRDPPPEWTPWGNGFVGSIAELTGLPIIERPDLGDGEWELTALIDPALIFSRPASMVVRKGSTADGKPTALDRAYWLVDFHIVMSVSPEYTGTGEVVVPQRLARFVQAYGHELDEKDIKVTRRRPDVPWEFWVYLAEVSVPREPVRYPAGCGDWRCGDREDWAEADPVDEPAVFAGAVTEKRFTESCAAALGFGWIPPDLLAEQLAYRRRQADGAPLWTIDIRPKGTS